jgi:competence protein ComEA
VSNPGNNPAAAININTANETELERLPHIGETLARRIVEFREQNGPFRRPENLLLVDGISEKRFQEIRPLIKTE